MGLSQVPIDAAGDLRAEIARHSLVIYELAPRVGLHPAHLGQVLRGQRSLSPDLERRIRGAVVQAGAEREAERVPA